MFAPKGLPLEKIEDRSNKAGLRFLLFHLVIFAEDTLLFISNVMMASFYPPV